MNTNKIVFQFAAKIDDTFFPFEMRKDPVTPKELGSLPGYRTADACQIVKLAEDTCKRRFAALIRTSDDKDAFLPLQEKIVADDLRVLLNQLMCKGQVKTLVAINGFIGIGDRWVTQCKSS